MKGLSRLALYEETHGSGSVMVIPSETKTSNHKREFLFLEISSSCFLVVSASRKMRRRQVRKVRENKYVGPGNIGSALREIVRRLLHQEQMARRWIFRPAIERA